MILTNFNAIRKFSEKILFHRHFKQELSNKEDANVVAVARDSSLKCDRMSKQVKIQSNFVICPPK